MRVSWQKQDRSSTTQELINVIVPHIWIAVANAVLWTCYVIDLFNSHFPHFRSDAYIKHT